MNIWIKSLITFGTLIHLTYNFLFPHIAFAHTQQNSLSFEFNQRLAAEYRAREEREALLKTLKQQAGVRYHVVTAYSSTEWQTDSTPFITASGTHVRDGIVAANSLPFGTKVMFPDLFGDKVFTVEDRMAKKNNHKIDVWFPTVHEARQFGIKSAKVLVLPHGA